MGFDYEKVEKAWGKPKKDIIKVNLDLKCIKNLENYITDLEQSKYVLDELEEWLEEQVIDRRYANDVERWSAYKSTLEKIQELKRSVVNK